MIKEIEISGKKITAVTLRYNHPDDITRIRESLISILRSALLNEFAFDNGCFDGGDVVEMMNIIESMNTIDITGKEVHHG